MQPKTTVLFKNYIPGIIWLLFVLVLIWIPGKDLPHSDFLFKIDFDKMVHAGIFGVLAILFCWPVYYTTINRSNKIIYFIVVALLTSAFGYGTELIQKYWAEGRSYDLMDWLADSAGALGAFIFCRLFLLKSKLQNKVA